MIPPLDLDDLHYSDLVSEARNLIPALCPTWTDQNPSDPGIALAELFAWLCEMVSYRVNRVPDASYASFLTLLDPSTTTGALPLDEAIRQTVSQLRQPYRAVTLDDYADLVLRQWPGSNLVKRIRCLVANGQITVALIPSPVVVNSVVSYAPSQALLDSLPGLISYLQERQLLTTKLQIILPRTLKITVAGAVYLGPGADAANVLARATAAIGDLLDPLAGGPDQGGWPFGRSLFQSDVYTVLSKVPGISFVEKISLNGDATNGLNTDQYEILALDQVNFAFWQPSGTLWTPSQ